jgi:uncharacterized coiled-coil protein SlyX
MSINEENKIIELEERMAHLERMIEQLNDIISTQQIDMLRLEKNTENLLHFAEDAKSMLIKSMKEETPPPHY